MKLIFKLTLFLFGLLVMINTTVAQQEAQYSMYFFNPLLINPGYAGSQEALTVTAIVRNQWASFQGAPNTQGLSIHSPLKNQNVGLGFTAINDQIGSNKNTGTYADFAYSIKLNKKNHRLVFGIKAGVDFFRTNFSGLRINDNTDHIYTDGFNYSTLLFNVGTGIYYYGKRFYLGGSTPALIKNKLNLPGGQKATQENHFYMFGGIVIKLNAAINMRPSFVIKYVNYAPLSVDGNLSFLFYGKVWLGAVYRYNSAAGLNMMFNVNQNFKVGYAYDYSLTVIQKYSLGSHEILLSYDLRKSAKGFRSPRYF